MDNWKDYDSFKSSSKLTKAYYDLVAKCLHQAIKNFENLDKFQNSLDIACGFGDSTKLLLENSKHIDAVDISKALIGKAKENPDLEQVNFYCSNFLDYVTEKKYDFLMGSWFHNQLKSEDEQMLAYKKIKNISTTNARFIFLFPNEHFNDSKTITFTKLAGLDQKVLARDSKYIKISYSMNGSPEAEMFCWTPSYLLKLYQKDFECYYFNCQNLLQQSVLYTQKLIEDVPFSVLVGHKKKVS